MGNWRVTSSTTGYLSTPIELESVSPSEKVLLKRLRDFVEAGRYPVPAAEGKTPGAWHFTFPRDVEEVWSLLEHLECDLQATGHPVLPPTNVRERNRPPGYGLS